jgi:hypothetical protein
MPLDQMSTIEGRKLYSDYCDAVVKADCDYWDEWRAVEEQNIIGSLFTRLCPHNFPHDKVRAQYGYVRDKFDNHRSVCLDCYKESIESGESLSRFHSPHGSLTIAKFIEVNYTNKVGRRVDDDSR